MEQITGPVGPHLGLGCSSITLGGKRQEDPRNWACPLDHRKEGKDTGWPGIQSKAEMKAWPACVPGARNPTRDTSAQCFLMTCLQSAGKGRAESQERKVAQKIPETWDQAAMPGIPPTRGLFPICPSAHEVTGCPYSHQPSPPTPRPSFHLSDSEGGQWGRHGCGCEWEHSDSHSTDA